ncbi:SDR family oxidoreductase [Chromatocurvus halotolerans]|uniref:NADP-dependent 3-hydroxy acid dehydrogenase YdfG n=1 Tax=Chromatocurvus halotolerans TaxID=1132028 RepID=A0A4R2KKC2_9GAMM|nr:SDR family oxidoreductase [Chromatocurvus halotolerans]TCO71076.1 NADP-dependent 3-hydroxy acid dehydrogenase YdfG [Chromatocurvus halotolerans]
MQVRDRVVVVTGGGNGIGKALCERFHAEGARTVVVADLEQDAAQGVADSISGVAYALDVRDEAQIDGMVAEVEGRFGGIDLFCSNAGIIAGDGEPWHVTSAANATWQAMWEIHVMAHVYAARACLPGMMARGEGYFLNTASAAGLLNQIGDAAYSTTKHAAVGFAEALAITHGDDGIKVSCLCPQAVATRMIGSVENGGTAGVDGVLTAQQVADAVIEGLAAEQFLILPHREVADYRQLKTDNYDRWLGGMRKLRRKYGNPTL